MTGSTPPWKRRSRKGPAKPREEAQGPYEAVCDVSDERDDERGSPDEGTASLASLPARDASPHTRARTGEMATAGTADPADADADGVTAPAAGPARRRAAAVRDGVRRSGALARTGMAKGGAAAMAGVGYIADRIIANAPRVPVRDLATLRRQFPGLGPEQLADKLVAGAANASSTVGASVGAAAMLPVPPAMPTELAAEITGVAAIELKLVAELHEVYGVRPVGGLKDRSTAYLTSWTHERGIEVTKPASVNAALGGQMKRELRQQIMKRTARNLPSLTPFMIGAAVGAVMNRRDTKKLADRVRADLRRVQVPWDALDDLPALEMPRDALELEGAGEERTVRGHRRLRRARGTGD
ncbi:hypothetical protein [Streptomyces beihaiensis]|uniref:Uncharacterized protein n=1 Tax=Streptomyces beihaiensis TaxID=2984495 RepID=A0ABT3TU92_9ACTN|nr:hypothetical protein [Streptomyces beihaiensis]MCX3060596.1 hypothetical protein [Streptomyces beihaiensis]